MRDLGKNDATEVLPEFQRPHHLLIDASSIISKMEAGYFDCVAQTLRLFAPRAVNEEAGYQDLMIRPLIRLLILGFWVLTPLFGVVEPEENLVETGNFAGECATVPEALRIVTYNVHGPLTQDLEAVYSVLKSDQELHEAHIWALQEVRTSTTRNFAREMAQRLGMNYVHAIARPRGGGWEGLSFLSRLPISEIDRLELPHLDTGERLRIGLFATFSMGDRTIRICNVHLPIRMKHEKRVEQLRVILDSFDSYPETTSRIVIGDFNTINHGLRTLYHNILLNNGFQTPFRGNAKTYQRYFFLRFKLDWIYLKGLEILAHGIEQRITASDHRPVWVDVR